MKLEAVGAITMSDLALEVCGQVDDGNGVEGAFLGADATTDAKRLRNESKTGIRLDLNAKFATANNGARLLAFLSALSRATLYWTSVWRGRDGGAQAGHRRTLSLLTMAILKEKQLAG